VRQRAAWRCAARNEALRLRIDGQVADAWLAVDAAAEGRADLRVAPAAAVPLVGRQCAETASRPSLRISQWFSIGAKAFARPHLDLVKLKVELQAKICRDERLAGGSL